MLFPPRCVSCGRSAPTLCATCRQRFWLLRSPLCARCGAPTAWPVERCAECSGRRLAFSTARAAVAYTGPARPLVAAWKEHGLRHVAALAAELIAGRLEPPAADVITYIPPDDGRRLERGHHPAERLARELARRWQLESDALLQRTRPAHAATRQTGLSLAERRRNVRGAFRGVTAAPGTVLLVDDVYTTGSTASAAASALRAAGAHTVHVVTFARTIR